LNRRISQPAAIVALDLAILSWSAATPFGFCVSFWVDRFDLEWLIFLLIATLIVGCVCFLSIGQRVIPKGERLLQEML
jgi:hypothetical protein